VSTPSGRSRSWSVAVATEAIRRARLEGLERWLAWVRLGVVPFAIFQVAVTTAYPGGYRAAAWATTAVFVAGTLALFYGARRFPGDGRLGFAALAFDALIVSAYVLVYNFERGTPIRQLLVLPIIEGALRYGIAGVVALVLASIPVAAVFELLRSRRLEPRHYQLHFVTFQIGVGLLVGLIIGWLVLRLRSERSMAEERAAEAEALRDRFGRRVDLLEAANRCARALASSLELEQAFAAFIRELRGLIPTDRTSIVLVEGDRAEVMATAGRGADTMFPPGSARTVEGSVLDEVLEGRLVYREDMHPPRYPEEHDLTALGLRSRVLVPLQLGARTIGMLALVREQPSAFSEDEIELGLLLGRVVANAVQNIRSYEAERRTVEELRRLSTLRADFVSLVSHELRSPMAAVIGAARTLQGRWRELNADQRESFLALIGDETARLADLISDVLDTSRIEAGTFTFSFGDVDVGELVREVVGTATVGQDEVKVTADVVGSLPRLRGDRRRLRQVLQNLVDNAVKYSSAGGEVRIRAQARNGALRVDITDEGPGIPYEDQRLIFEKFGRSSGSGAKPGTGLGLFIARSIVEAHGGTLGVESIPACGSTFVIELPVDA
jgi:signal transduction histidine kinase